MRVLLTNDLAPDGGGGAEAYVSRVAAALTAAGDEVEVVTAERPHLGAARVLDLWDPWAARRLERAGRELCPDVVHHNNVLRELSVSVLGRPAGVPQVLTVHDHRLVGSPDPSVRGVRRVVDRTLKRHVDLATARRRVDVAVGVSAPLVAALRARRFRHVVEVPPPGAAPVVQLLPVSECTDVLFVGRLVPEKGLAVLLDAFALLRDRHPAVALVCAGDGPLAASLAGDERVRLMGRLGPAELSSAYARARVVVVPSVPRLRPEGTPLAAVDALMHGRPLVVSDDPGLAALVGATRAGLVVPAEDPTALAAALDTLLSDPRRAAAYGEQGQHAAHQRYAPDAVVPALHDAYRSARQR